MKIAIATTTRADWGLLSPLAAALRDSGADIRIMAAAMHFDPLMGETWREIEADGFALAAHTVYRHAGTDSGRMPATL